MMALVTNRGIQVCYYFILKHAYSNYCHALTIHNKHSNH